MELPSPITQTRPRQRLLPRLVSQTALALACALLTGCGRAEVLTGPELTRHIAPRLDTRSVRAVPADSLPRGASAYVDRALTDANGQQLGQVKDILFDAYSGHVSYAVVGGTDLGSLRLVPFAAIEAPAGDGALVVTVSPDRWQDVTLVDPHELETGWITVGGAQRRLLADLFDQAPTRTADDLHAVKGGTHLVPASRLHGKRVSTGSENVGIVGDIVLADDGLTGEAVLLPERDLAPANRRFLLPLRQLNLAMRDQNPLITSLTRSDFRGLADGEGAGREPPAPPPALSPTGR